MEYMSTFRETHYIFLCIVSPDGVRRFGSARNCPHTRNAAFYLRANNGPSQAAESNYSQTSLQRTPFRTNKWLQRTNFQVPISANVFTMRDIRTERERL